MGLIKTIGYVLASITALGAVLATGLLSLVIGLFTGIVAIGTFVIAFVAVGIKEYWESRPKNK